MFRNDEAAKSMSLVGLRASKAARSTPPLSTRFLAKVDCVGDRENTPTRKAVSARQSAVRFVAPSVGDRDNARLRPMCDLDAS